MAKKQTFGDKVKKGSAAESLKYVKVISVKRSKNTNSLKFVSVNSNAIFPNF